MLIQSSLFLATLEKNPFGHYQNILDFFKSIVIKELRNNLNKLETILIKVSLREK